MAREIPEVVRAVAGLAATVLDEARKLPETLPGLPVRLIGQALQTSLRLQQQYSGLVARGDEVFTGLRGDSEPGMATFDDDVPAPTGTPAPRSSAFDRVADPDLDPVAEELADELADDLAVADLPLADTDGVPAAELATTLTDGGDDLSTADVAALPDDPAADTLTAVVDELAAEVADEVAAEMPDAVPDEVLEDVTADAVAQVAEEETAVEDAVADELIADAVVGDALPAKDALPDEDAVPAETTREVPSLDDLTADVAPEQTRVLDDATPDVAALEDAAEELVDLGGPEAAESVTPGSDVTDSLASDPLVAPGEPATVTDSAATDSAASDAAIDDAATETPATDDAPAATDAEPGPSSPVEGYDAFSIPALRGHLRAYPAETVADLLDYERATQARAPFVTLLQNRLEKLSNDRG